MGLVMLTAALASRNTGLLPAVVNVPVPRPAPTAIEISPALSVTPPEKVFAPLSARMPGPFLVRE